MTDTTDAPSRAFLIIREVLATPTTATADTIGDKTAARIEQRLKAAGLLVDAPTEERIEQAERLSMEVLNEYRKIAAWLEAQAATRGPVGDTMHGLAAEALTNLIEHEYSRHKIPLYGMLDLWMALGITSHPEFDEFYDEHGYAETWSRLLDGVRRLRRAFDVHEDNRGKARAALAAAGVAPQDREKLIAEAREFIPAWSDVQIKSLFDRMADALAAQPVLDPEKVANVLDEHEYMYSQYGCDCGWAGPGTHRDHTARALCEAAKRGELS